MTKIYNVLYRIPEILFGWLIIALLTSCATKHSRFFRGDVIGFSDEVQTSYTTATRGLFMNMRTQSDPFDLLNINGKKAMNHEIDIVQRGENTAAYYAMELAAKRIKYVRKKVAKRDPKTRYYIFLLTDGLDNASPQTAKHDKRILFNRTPEQYKKRLQRKLKSAMGWFGKNQFEVYPLFYEGEDTQETKQKNKMTDAQYDDYLQKNMKCFRYSSEGIENAPELIHGNNFKVIFKKLREKLNNSSYTFKIPKSYANKEIRMTFLDSLNRKAVLTAKLTKSFFSYSLKDVQFSNGVTYGEIRSVSSFYSDDYMNTYFLIDDIRLNGIAYLPETEKVTQEYKDDIWILNSEYEEVPEVAINTYFILVMDGSRSLDGKNGEKEGFKEEQEMAREIMDILTPRDKKRTNY